MKKLSQNTNNAEKMIARKKISDRNSSGSISQSDHSEDEKMPMMKN